MSGFRHVHLPHVNAPSHPNAFVKQFFEVGKDYRIATPTILVKSNYLLLLFFDLKSSYLVAVTNPEKPFA